MVVYKREFAYPMEASTSPLSVQHTRAAVIVPLSFHCHGIEDQPPHLSHRPCSTWEGLWYSICRGGRVICQQFIVCSLSGGAPYWRAVVQVCGLAPLSQATVLLAMVAPLRSAPASALPEDSSQGLVKEKKPFEIFYSSIIIYRIYTSMNSMVHTDTI